MPPPSSPSFPRSTPAIPGHKRQIERLEPQLRDIASEFKRYSGSVDPSMVGGEPELVLVLELANRVENLQRAVEAAGLEWLGEWDIDIEGDEDFPAKGTKTERSGRLFVSMVNQQGLDEILSLWKKWQRKQRLPRGKTPWRNIFSCLKNIRRWGTPETLDETGMRDYFAGFSDEAIVNFQIECFYHQDQTERDIVESDIRKFLDRAGGETISDFIHIPEIAFHAVKASMPANKIRALLANEEEQQHLFVYPGVMYFRQAGQSIVSSDEGDGEETEYPQEEADQPPIAAILDGAPNLQHHALRNRISFDDPFGLANKYQPGERIHGTAMASLIVHGDISNSTRLPIHSQIHHVAVMEPDVNAGQGKNRPEHFPADCFVEDRIEQAVRRTLESDGEADALAPTVKIINLSLGDPARPFLHTPSPWARLLDWLSWKYRVLFCVSAGNYEGDYDFGMSSTTFNSKSDTEKTNLLIEAIQNGLSKRRLLAPAESINALTVGALHHDESGNNYPLGDRMDLLPDNRLLSPLSRLGHGFRRSVKPEVYFPGGRQLYRDPLPPKATKFELSSVLSMPGQKVAADSNQQGKLSDSVFTRGTSNANALATRACILIHEVLEQLNRDNQTPIPDNLMAVLIKALLVHGSLQDGEAKKVMEHLKNPENSRTFKTTLARYLGYGAVDVERVLACTAQRGTVIGFGEIKSNEMYQYRFPVPQEFSGEKTFRRMVITLAWLSPINARHRYLREAKLEILPGEKWNETPLELKRTDGDHLQVKRGTVQHEVLEGKNQLAAFQQGAEIVLNIRCRKDATEQLEDSIPYGLAVTLEAAEESVIPIYEVIKARLVAQVGIQQP